MPPPDRSPPGSSLGLGIGAVLVGCDADVLPELHRELRILGVEVISEEASLDRLLSGWRVGTRQRHALIATVRASEDFGALRQVAATYAGWPIVALVPSTDPQVLLRAMRSGATQVVPLPLVGPDFAEAIQCVGSQLVERVADKLVIAVAGTTGGAGASTLAANLGYELAEGHGRKCVLVDLSMKMGMLADLLDVTPEHTIHQLLSEVNRLDPVLIHRVLTPVSRNLSLLAGPQDTIDTQSVRPADLFQVINALLFTADVVVLDVPTTFDEIFFDVLAASHHAVLVAQQKIPAVRAFKLIKETLERENASGHIHLVVNRYDKKVPGFSADDLRRLLKVSHLFTVAQDSGAVLQAVNNGLPLRRAAPNSPALADVNQLIRALLPAGNATSGRPQAAGLLSRLFGLK